MSEIEAVTPLVYITRSQARELIRSKGIPIGDATLADLAGKGRGPDYCVINGRACYTRDSILTWISSQAAAPVRRSSERTAAGAS